MAGILNIRHIFILSLSILLFSSCSEDIVSKQKFIEDNFLAIVDTTAYQYGSFRPLPPYPNKINRDSKKKSTLSIKLEDEITYNSRLQKEIELFFNEHEKLKLQFKNLLEDKNIDKIRLNKFPKKIGKYLVSMSSEKADVLDQNAGKIEIKNFKLNKNKAFLIVIKSVEHSEIVILKFFTKEDKNWKMIKQETLFES